MRRLILSFSLPLALAACSRSEPPAEAPAPTPAEAEAPPSFLDAEPVRAEGVFPKGFPYEKMEGERILESTSFASEGVQHYEVGLESEVAPDLVADYWASELEAKGVTVVRQRVEEEDLVRIVLQGEDDAGVYSRVSVLYRETEDEEGASTSRVNVYVGKR